MEIKGKNAGAFAQKNCKQRVSHFHELLGENMTMAFHPEVNPSQNKSCGPFRYSRQRPQLFIFPITVSPAERKSIFHLQDFVRRMSLLRSISKERISARAFRQRLTRSNFSPRTLPSVLAAGRRSQRRYFLRSSKAARGDLAVTRRLSPPAVAPSRYRRPSAVTTRAHSGRSSEKISPSLL
ncbi:hypothetical protein HMPREF1207_03445 [Paenibacillus sp. HGH0039]|nr:hypothetical protein HMPREF1207_03445 [Paenibacillus sp. HGH0039]